MHLSSFDLIDDLPILYLHDRTFSMRMFFFGFQKWELKKDKYLAIIIVQGLFYVAVKNVFTEDA